MRTGIMLNDLGQSQDSFMAITYTNTLIANSQNNDISIFVNDDSLPVVRPLCLVTTMDRIHGFNGMLVATNLYLASLLINTNSPIKVFYVWDLQWLRDYNDGNFLENNKILRNKDIKLVARSKSHAQAIKNYCNREVDAIIPNFNLLTIITKFKNEE